MLKELVTYSFDALFMLRCLYSFYRNTMQTFLPYSDFIKSFMTLDRDRLGNQVYRETLTLLRGGWPHHPISKMWKKHKQALARYGLAGAQVMALRNWHTPQVIEYWLTFYKVLVRELPKTPNPPWIGNIEVHASHRSNLLRKNPLHYSQFGWTEPDDLEYVWVVENEAQENLT